MPAFLGIKGPTGAGGPGSLAVAKMLSIEKGEDNPLLDAALIAVR